jgi:alpha-methylacyl-CoA racemase
MSMIWSFRAAGFWRDERGVNLLDTGAHFYETYETADGKYLAVGAIEGQFYAELRRLAGLEDDAELDAQMNFSAWPALKEKLATVFLSRTRNEWMEVFDGTDACVAPVLSLAEAPMHPHNAARGTFVTERGVVQPAPAPRFSITPSTAPRMASGNVGADTDSVLAGIGYDQDRIAALKRDRILA